MERHFLSEEGTLGERPRKTGQVSVGMRWSCSQGDDLLEQRHKRRYLVLNIW